MKKILIIFFIFFSINLYSQNINKYKQLLKEALKQLEHNNKIIKEQKNKINKYKQLLKEAKERLNKNNQLLKATKITLNDCEKEIKRLNKKLFFKNIKDIKFGITAFTNFNDSAWFNLNLIIWKFQLSVGIQYIWNEKIDKDFRFVSGVGYYF